MIKVRLETMEHLFVGEAELEWQDAPQAIILLNADNALVPARVFFKAESDPGYPFAPDTRSIYRERTAALLLHNDGKIVAPFQGSGARR